MSPSATSASALKDEKIDDEFARDVLRGLTAQTKTLSSKYFYDDIGSALFQAITQHPDYYPTSTELGIIKAYQHRLPLIIKQPVLDIIELGAGDGHKTQLILEGFLQAGYRIHYYPIDISPKAMELLEQNITAHPNLSVHGVVAQYIEGMNIVNRQSNNSKLVLFLGSNIGNFDPLHSQSFIASLRHELQEDDYLLLGADLKKDISVLTKAYNDSSGLTAAFNINLLTRINRELDADFDESQFYHHGMYNPQSGAMESYLIAQKPMTVKLGAMQTQLHFKAFEAIHMEYSYKYLLDDVAQLGESAHFTIVENFVDDKNYFVDSLWQAVPAKKR